MSFHISEPQFTLPTRKNDQSKRSTITPLASTSGIVDVFMTNHEELNAYRHGETAELDGYSLSLATVAAVARYSTSVKLNQSNKIKTRVAKSRAVIDNKIRSQVSIYGVSTGFGGSADTRTSAHTMLGLALLQHQSSGILSTTVSASALPLGDPGATTIMPEAWVRAAMLIRANSLVRGHSAVRWDLLQSLADFLQHHITPLVPLRGSISASGDLSPLSYVALALSGNSAIHVYNGHPSSNSMTKRIVSAPKAMEKAGLKPISLAPKEHLGLLNGTAFSAAVASLALVDVVQLAVLAQVCTAMGTEALLGTRGSYAPFIHEVARPHPGQIEVAKVLMNLLEGSSLAGEVHEAELTVDEDKGKLRQDRYPLRTAPQFIGPQLEDILHAVQVVTQECNSTTDNPLVDGETGTVYHGGNFQAMSVTNAMEKTRLALHHLGKILFSQSTEMLNPACNRGLPPSVASTDPSLNYGGKGIDIATAAYVSELGHLANPVSTHIQSSEMHNQAVNSLALISARATIASIDVLSMLTASYLYVLCQALDLRALQQEFQNGLEGILGRNLERHLDSYFQSKASYQEMLPKILQCVNATMESTSTMDAAPRMQTVAAATTTPLFDSLSQNQPSNVASAQLLGSIKSFQASVAEEGLALLKNLRSDFLNGKRGRTPASKYMGKTKSVYEFIRVKLGVRMHGRENLNGFEGGLHSSEGNIGSNITKIYEAIRDGEMQDVLAGLLAAPSQKKEFAMAKL